MSSKRKIILVLMSALATVTVLYTNCGQMQTNEALSNSAFGVNPPLPITGRESYAVPIAMNPNNVNIPTVSVTICTPGTQKCQTIDNIELDTGSTGLRLFPSAIGVSLQQLGNYAECYRFGSGVAFWGPVAKADILLGEIRASNVNIQLIQSSYATPGADCDNNGSFTIETGTNFNGTNGLLGVMPFVTDCGESCAPDATAATYYACSGSTCSDVTMPSNLQVPNPIAALSTNNNGYAIQLPAIPSNGTPTVSGAYLVLGIATNTDNKPPSGVTALQIDSNSYFTTSFYGLSLTESFLDSGSFYLAFPTGSNAGVNTCELAFGSYVSTLFCPQNLTTLTATLKGNVGSSELNVGFTLAPGAVLLNPNNVAYSDVAQPVATALSADGSQTSTSFDWGLPFFFGRTIYFGMENSAVPVLGPGPFNAL